MILTQEIKARMTAKEITQEELARKLGITSKTLGTRFKTKIFPSDEIDSIIKILDIKNPMDIFFVD
jgi:transcriptional regulator with XRE-family HTH domain